MKSAPMVGLMALVVALHGVIAVLAQDRAHALALMLTGLLALVLLGILFKQDRLGMGWVVGAGVVARVLMLSVPAILSDDAWRYFWDGLLILNGQSPYAFTPAAQPAFLGESWYAYFMQNMNSPGYYSVYPPVIQYIHATAAWAGWGASDPEAGFLRMFLALKGMAFIAELGTLFLLSRLVSARFVLLYALHPLIPLELVGLAHTEVFAIFYMVLAGYAWKQASAPGALWAFGLAGGIKLYPALFALPFLKRAPFGWTVAGALLGLLLLWPLYTPGALTNIRSSVDLYAGHFEFNAGPYFLLKGILYFVTGHDLGFLVAKGLRWLFIGVAGWVLWSAWRSRITPMEAVWRLMIAFVLTQASLHPWYFAPVIALTILKEKESWAWYALGAISLGTYARYLDGPYAEIVALGWAVWAYVMVRANFEKYVTCLLAYCRVCTRISSRIASRERSPLR